MAATIDSIQLKPGEFKLFQALMYDHAGVRMGQSKHTLVQNRLRKRLRALGLRTYRDYHDYIRDPAHKDEFQACLNCLTTNETFFFRHKNHWDFVVGTFIPSLRRSGSGSRSVRIWSGAASTGAEAYSAAIALYDTLGTEGGWQITVDATDINEDVLAAARQACYDTYALQKLTPACVRRYFEPLPDENRHRVTQEVRALVRFSRHNLLEPKRGPAYDLVFLRNVLIYFDQASKRQVLEHVTQSLKAGGYLILGGAESLSACKDGYDYVQPTIYRKRGNA